MLENISTTTILSAIVLILLIYYFFCSCSWDEEEKDILKTRIKKLGAVYDGEFLNELVNCISRNYSYEDIAEKDDKNLTFEVFHNCYVKKCFGRKQHWNHAFRVQQLNLMLSTKIDANQAVCMINSFEQSYDPLYFTLNASSSEIQDYISSVSSSCNLTKKVKKSVSFKDTFPACVDSSCGKPDIMNPVFCNAVLASPEKPLVKETGGLKSSGDVYEDISRCSNYYAQNGLLNDPNNYGLVCESLENTMNAGSVYGIDACNNYRSCVHDNLCTKTPESQSNLVCNESNIPANTRTGATGCAQFYTFDQNGNSVFNVPPQYSVACAPYLFANAKNQEEGCAMLKDMVSDSNCGSKAEQLYQKYNCSDQCQGVVCPEGKSCYKGICVQNNK